MIIANHADLSTKLSWVKIDFVEKTSTRILHFKYLINWKSVLFFVNKINVNMILISSSIFECTPIQILCYIVLPYN